MQPQPTKDADTQSDLHFLRLSCYIEGSSPQGAWVFSKLQIESVIACNAKGTFFFPFSLSFSLFFFQMMNRFYSESIFCMDPFSHRLSVMMRNYQAESSWRSDAPPLHPSKRKTPVLNNIFIRASVFPTLGAR